MGSEKSLVWSMEDLRLITEEELQHLIASAEKELKDRKNTEEKKARENLANAMERFLEVCHDEAIWTNVYIDEDMSSDGLNCEVDITECFSEAIRNLRMR